MLIFPQFPASVSLQDGWSITTVQWIIPGLTDCSTQKSCWKNLVTFFSIVFKYLTSFTDFIVIWLLEHSNISEWFLFVCLFVCFWRESSWGNEKNQKHCIFEMLRIFCFEIVQHSVWVWALFSSPVEKVLFYLKLELIWSDFKHLRVRKFHLTLTSGFLHWMKIKWSNWQGIFVSLQHDI